MKRDFKQWWSETMRSSPGVCADSYLSAEAAFSAGNQIDKMDVVVQSMHDFLLSSPVLGEYAWDQSIHGRNAKCSFYLGLRKYSEYVDAQLTKGQSHD